MSSRLLFRSSLAVRFYDLIWCIHAGFLFSLSLLLLSSSLPQQFWYIFLIYYVFLTFSILLRARNMSTLSPQILARVLCPMSWGSVSIFMWINSLLSNFMFSPASSSTFRISSHMYFLSSCWCWLGTINPSIYSPCSLLAGPAWPPLGYIVCNPSYF